MKFTLPIKFSRPYHTLHRTVQGPALTALFLAVFAASLALAPWVARGNKPPPPATPPPAGQQTTSQIDLTRQGRFGLNAVASLLGLTQCNDTKYYTDCPAPKLREVILKLIQVALGFTSLIALIFVLYGGLTWITAMGNQEKVTKGRDILIWAGIGLFVVMFAWGIITYIIYTSSRVVA